MENPTLESALLDLSDHLEKIAKQIRVDSPGVSTQHSYSIARFKIAHFLRHQMLLKREKSCDDALDFLWEIFQ